MQAIGLPLDSPDRVASLEARVRRGKSGCEETVKSCHDKNDHEFNYTSQPDLTLSFPNTTLCSCQACDNIPGRFTQSCADAVDASLADLNAAGADFTDVFYIAGKCGQDRNDYECKLQVRISQHSTHAFCCPSPGNCSKHTPRKVGILNTLWYNATSLPV
jgi:hypothetical protein